VTITARMAKHLEDLAMEIMGNYRPARRQLEQWTGEYRSSVIGAAPDTSPPSFRDETTVELTSVERQALRPDKATYTLEQMHSTLVRVAGDGRSMWGRIDGTPIPEPANTDAALLAVMMWAARRADKDRNAVSSATLRPMRGSMTYLAGLCKIHLPPPATKIADACHAHAAAGLDAEVDPRYRRQHLCDWCYKFRAVHGVNPPPRIVKLHDRGIKMSATILRREGIVTGAA
jgi:hypothetical protein